MSVAQLVLAIDLAAVGLLYPAMQWRRAVRTSAFAIALAAVLATPFMIRLDTPVTRGIVALAAVYIAVKWYDLFAGATPARPRAREFVAYLLNPLWHVRRSPVRSPARREDASALMFRLAAAVATVALLIVVFRADWGRHPFIMEHAAKALAITLTMTALGNTWASIWRLGGGTSHDGMAHPVLAVTPADFWRRWNVPVQQFFHVHVFTPAGGRARLIRATLATFAVSAVIHEYLFSTIAGRFQGYQLAFFMINGLASVATLRLRPRGWRAVLGWVGTLTFLIATSVLFFASIAEIFPFYAERG